MDRDFLEDFFEEEKRVAHFTKLPDKEFVTIAKLIFGLAAEEVARVEEIKTIIKDINDTRHAKLRTAIDALFIGPSEQADSTSSTGKVSFTNLTNFEIHSVRPFLPYASDLVARLERVYQQQISSINNDSTTNSSSYFSSSSNY